MAEINIEKKKKPVWPWILLLVIVGLLVWAIYEFTSDNSAAHLPTVPASEPALATGTKLSLTFYRT